jgi:hypothetical protein
MSEEFLEQGINIKFYVKLRKNTSDMQCSPRLTEEKLSVFEWHKLFRESLHIEITNEDNAYHFL